MNEFETVDRANYSKILNKYSTPISTHIILVHRNYVTPYVTYFVTKSCQYYASNSHKTLSTSGKHLCCVHAIKISHSFTLIPSHNHRKIPGIFCFHRPWYVSHMIKLSRDCSRWSNRHVTAEAERREARETSYFFLYPDCGALFWSGFWWLWWLIFNLIA